VVLVVLHLTVLLAVQLFMEWLLLVVEQAALVLLLQPLQLWVALVQVLV